MRLLNAANRRKRLWRRAIAAGQLIDVTDEARIHGINDKVCISNRLWTSLIRPYPFARPNDCVALSTLLGVLKSRLAVSQISDANALLLLPRHVPEWFAGPCYLKMLVTFSNSANRSILIQPFSDPFPSRISRRDDSLPASLLVRLAENVQVLSVLSHTAKQGLLDSMQRIVYQLIEANPFCIDIKRRLSACSSSKSERLRLPGEYSESLTYLDELLAILVACCSPHALGPVEALRSHYRAVVSPLGYFADVIEHILQLAARIDLRQALIPVEPFPRLLNIYVEVHARLQKLETVIPKDALSIAQSHMRLMAAVLPPKEAAQLSGIIQACDRIFNTDSTNRPHSVALADPNVNWH